MGSAPSDGVLDADGAAPALGGAAWLFAAAQHRECVLTHVPDVDNASDYLTKFVNNAKQRRCDAWATGSARAVPLAGV